MNNHTNTPSPANIPVDIVTLGERGQVVIPAAMREQVGLKPGDKLMVFTKHNEVVCLVSASSMRRLVNILTEQLKEVEAPEPATEKPR